MPRLFKMENIEKATGASGPTIKRWAREELFPAVKIGGIWVSDSDMIDEWTRNYITESLKGVKRGNFHAVKGKNW